MKYVNLGYIKEKDRSIMRKLMLRRGMFETTEIRLGYKIYTRHKYIPDNTYVGLDRLLLHFITNSSFIK